MALTFTAAGIDMGGIPDASGCIWWAGVTGWDTPAIDMATTQRETDHGARLGTPYYQGRTLTIAGYVQCPNVTALRAARDQINAAFPIGVNVAVTSNEGRTATGQINGPMLLRSISSQVLQFSVPLICGDPRKYGSLQRYTFALSTATDAATFPLTFPLALSGDTGQTVSNPGTVAARPLITFVGPVANPSMTNTTSGKRLAYNLMLAAGSQLVVSTLDGSVLHDGVPARGFQTPDSQPFELGRGLTTLSFTASAYSASAQAWVDVAPAYL